MADQTEAAATYKMLRVQLSSADPDARLAALRQLATAGENAGLAAVPLVKAVANDSEETRELAVAALEECGPPPGAGLAELVQLLDDPSTDVAYWAATLIGRSGRDAKSAVAGLMAALSSSSNLIVRERAAWALGRIGSAGQPAVGVLQEAAASDQPRLTRLAKEALAAIQTELGKSSAPAATER